MLTLNNRKALQIVSAGQINYKVQFGSTGSY